MNPSPLRLEGHFLSKLALDSANPPSPDAEPEIRTESQVLRNEKDSGQFLVELTVHLANRQDSKSPYTGAITFVGIFRVEAGWPEAKAETLVRVNGSSMLYAAVRELLLSLTARGPWPSLCLPMVSFSNPAASPPPRKAKLKSTKR